MLTQLAILTTFAKRHMHAQPITLHNTIPNLLSPKLYCLELVYPSSQSLILQWFASGKLHNKAENRTSYSLTMSKIRP